MTSRLLVKPKATRATGLVQTITPENANWRYAGLEVVDLRDGEALGRDCATLELCLVLLSGVVDVQAGDRHFPKIGSRGSPFEGKPSAVYVPSRTQVTVKARTACELAVCSAPAEVGRFAPRLISPENVQEEIRGTGTNTRSVYSILPESEPAERLLITEVRTPAGHWSSYPPHKHDSSRDGETQLEEIYYHRLSPPNGFAFQRVWTDDREIDETMAVEDRDVVLVPRGYHPVGVPHGIESYYLNVMAGPVRRWQFRNAPGYEFLTRPAQR